MTDGTPSALLLFAGTYAAMVSVPGANFLVVSRASLIGRPTGTAAALGVATGASFNAAAVVIALLVLSGLDPAEGLGRLQLAFCLFYAFLLLRAGIRCLRDVARPGGGAGRALQHAEQQSAADAFRLGFLTAATNPMSISFFLAAGGLLMVAVGRGAVMLASPLLVFSVATGWFGVLALVLSAPSARRAYMRMRTPADICIGGLLLVAGCLVLVRVLTRL